MGSQSPPEEVLDSQEVPTIPMGGDGVPPAGGDGVPPEGGDGVPPEGGGGVPPAPLVSPEGGDGVPASQVVQQSDWLSGVQPKTSLRKWLPAEWRGRFDEGGIADVLVPAATMQHRIETITAQLVAHAALTVLMETMEQQPCATMWLAIEQADEADVLSSRDLKSLKALNREANACKHDPVTSGSASSKRSAPSKGPFPLSKRR